VWGTLPVTAELEASPELACRAGGGHSALSP
jgi:hypothetical protein